MATLRAGIAQINPVVGDFSGNVEKIIAAAEQARGKGADLLVFPEMAVCGFPVEDLAFRGSFLQACEKAVRQVAKGLSRSNLLLVLGCLESSVELFDAAAIIHRGQVLGYARKRHLFCCGRFDEFRVFSAGDKPLVIETPDYRAAVTIGDDLGYPVFPGAVEILINLWNEPYHFGHRLIKEEIMREKAKEEAVAMVLVTPAGAQDDLVFEGSSVIIDGFGGIAARARAFSEDLLLADLDLGELSAHRKRVFHHVETADRALRRAEVIKISTPLPARKRPARVKPRIEPQKKGPAELFNALSLAVKDYVKKNGFDRAVVGVSGGIDSALTLALATAALGAENVLAVSMPGPYTSPESRRDAKKVAQNLGAEFLEIPITPAFEKMLASLKPAFKESQLGVTAENLQARLRGVILMALANQRRALLLATSNKSEAAVGYCTLYGDTNGAYAPLKDIYKTQVYEIAGWLNRDAGKEVIPQSIIERAPSAELRPGQTDQDSLPPYPVLDRILNKFLEGQMSISELIKEGEPEETVYQVMRMLISSEFKRRQSPIGPHVSERPLAELRLPITAKTGWWLERGKDQGKSSAEPSPREKPAARKSRKKGRNP